MIVDFLIIGIPLAVVCARLYYVFSEWGYYSQNPDKIIAVWEGGLAIYGAVIGAIIAAFIFCRWKKVPVGDLLDFGGVGLIIGQCIGRWGNFVNQEAFGVAVTDPNWQWFPFAVNITRTHTVAEYNSALGMMEQVPCEAPWHLATFFYESLWNLIVFVLLLAYFKKAKRRGNVFAMYLVLYGAGRAFVEGLRTDSLWLIPGVVRISQLVGILCVVLGILYLLIMRKRPYAFVPYEGPYSLTYQKPEAQKAEKEETKLDKQNASATAEHNTGDAAPERKKEDA